MARGEVVILIPLVFMSRIQVNIDLLFIFAVRRVYRREGVLFIFAVRREGVPNFCPLKTFSHMVILVRDYLSKNRPLPGSYSAEKQLLRT